MNYDLVIYLSKSQPTSHTHVMIGPSEPKSPVDSVIYIALRCHRADAVKEQLVRLETVDELMEYFPDVENQPFNSGYLSARGVLATGTPINCLFVSPDDPIYQASYVLMSDSLARRIRALVNEPQIKHALRRVGSSSSSHRYVM